MYVDTTNNYKLLNIKIYKKNNINSFIIALFLCSRLIVQSMPLFFQINNILVIFLALLFVIAFFNNKFIVNVKFLSIFALIVTTFLICFFLNGINSKNSLYLLDFLIYGGIGLYLSGVVFSISNVYKYNICISMILLPFAIMKNFKLDPETWMGISYSILPLLFSAIIYISTVKTNKYFKLFTILTVIIYLVKILPIFTRGAIIAVMLFCIVFIILKCFRSSFLRNFLFLSILTFFWFIYMNLEKILSTILIYLLNNGLHLRFIEKTLHLMSYDNLLNGRKDFYQLAIDGIQKSPLFGHGIGSFETNTGLIYVHNLFLQLAYEGGVFFLVPCSVLLIAGLYMIILSKKIDASYKIFMWFIYTIGIFRLLVSSVYWREPAFWFLIGFLIFFKKTIRQND